MSGSRSITIAPSIASVGLMPYIGQGLPSYASSGTAANANDSTYTTYWQPTGDPSYIAFDISSIVSTITPDSGGFCSLVLSWYTNDVDYLPATAAADIPSNYTIDVNGAAGGSYPASGWTTVTTITGNFVHSRCHIINVAGKNWVRMSITQQSDGSTGGSVINVDLWNACRVTNAAHTQISCGWWTLGDSINAHCFEFGNTYNGNLACPSVGQSVKTLTGNTPLIEAGGESGQTSGTILNTYLTGWLPLIIEKYVTVELGTNDADFGVSGATYLSNMSSIISALINNGMTPILPTVPYNTNSPAAVITMNNQHPTLFSTYPSLIAGPDMYTYFLNGTVTLIDGIHPDGPGEITYRSIYASFIANLTGGN